MIICTALGQVYYKHYFNQRKKYYLVLAIFFFISTPYLNYKALKGLSLDFVYLASAFILIFVQIFSYITLEEKQTKKQFLGTIVIVVGLLIYSL